MCIAESSIYAVGLLQLTEMIMEGIKATGLWDRSLWVSGFLFWEGMFWLFFFWRAMTFIGKSAGRKEYAHTDREYGIFLLLLVLSAALAEGMSLQWAQFGGTLLSLGLFALLLYCRDQRKKQEEGKQEEEKQGEEDSSLQRQDDYMKSVERQYQRTRELWHDLKNHIHVLEILAGEERLTELNDYLASFKRDVEIRMLPLKTGCTAVDALLSDKLYHAGRKNMDLLLQVCDLSKILIRPSDLCAVLGNLLDNAMEACEKLPEHRGTESCGTPPEHKGTESCGTPPVHRGIEPCSIPPEHRGTEPCSEPPEGRRIQLRIKRQENFYYITVINSAVKPKGERKALISEKQGRENGVGHGLGLRSVERIAHQYGGSLVTDYGDGEFRAIVRMEG